MVRRLLEMGKRVGVLAVDLSSPVTGGAVHLPGAADGAQQEEEGYGAGQDLGEVDLPVRQTPGQRLLQGGDTGRQGGARCRQVAASRNLGGDTAHILIKQPAQSLAALAQDLAPDSIVSLNAGGKVVVTQGWNTM